MYIFKFDIFPLLDLNYSCKNNLTESATRTSFTVSTLTSVFKAMSNIVHWPTVFNHIVMNTWIFPLLIF